MRSQYLLLATIVLSGEALGQNPHVAPNAPQDRPHAADSVRWARLDSAMAPYVAQARVTYQAAKRRYLAGLPSGQSLFLTTRVKDTTGHLEQVFIAVDSIRGTRVFGRIWSEISLVQGFRLRQPYAFLEDEILDWLITKPDGSEEGNVVGKFLDTYRP
jgi:hypothetical protein